MNNRRLVTSALATVASILLLASLRLPLWHIRLEAPQYHGPEALCVSVYPNSFRGDLRELTVLQKYIGVHIPASLPQFKWLPEVLFVAALIGLVTAFLPFAVRRLGLILVASALVLTLAFAAAQAAIQIHDIGHQRDEKTILVGVKDFTPPFIGTAKIAQFTVTSWFGSGAWLIGAALASQCVGACLVREKKVFKEELARPVVASASPAALVP